MPVYTVHEPPARKDEAPSLPDDYVFVRDGFYFWAFALGPFWMLWRRLWLVLLIYGIALVAIEIVLWSVGVGYGGHFLAGLVLAVLVGLEASTLQRWTFDRRGWKNLGVVVADEAETAERNFFAAMNERNTKSPAPPKSSGYTVSGPKPSTDVIGLFPEPGSSR